MKRANVSLRSKDIASTDTFGYNNSALMCSKIDVSIRIQICWQGNEASAHKYSGLIVCYGCML